MGDEDKKVRPALAYPDHPPEQHSPASAPPTDMRNKTPRRTGPENTMKLLVLAMAVAATTPKGEAAEAQSPVLQLKPKAAIVSTMSERNAPFAASPSAEPGLELIPRPDPRQEASRSSCSGERSLCYDPGSGRIVYKPARNFMPDIPGFRRENISVRRDRIVFRYSF
jgi:hypothetical protein